MTQLQDPPAPTAAAPPIHQVKAWTAAAAELADAKTALIDSLAAIAPLANHSHARVVVGQLNDLINAVEGLADWMAGPDDPTQ